MAKRYSGNATVNVVWSDSANGWRASVSVDGYHVDTVTVTQSRSGPDTRIAVDSPEAYDHAAATALSFVSQDYDFDDKLDFDDRGIVVYRTK